MTPTLGMNDHLRPDGKPAPPRPRSPLFFIWSTIQSEPLDTRSLVRYQSPRFSAPCGGPRRKRRSSGDNRQQRAGRHSWGSVACSVGEGWDGRAEARRREQAA